MKKILLFASALAGLFLAGSCQRENLEPVEQANTVTYTVQVADAIATKALGDDVSNVNKLHYEVYRTAGEGVTTFTDADRLLYHKTADVVNGKATIELELVNDQNFTVLFWAQVEKDAFTSPYVVKDLTNVSIKDVTVLSLGNSLKANEVDYAAFSGVDFIKATETLSDKTVSLTRPVAQLNLATTYESLNAFDTPVNLEGSYVKVTGLSKTFDVAKQVASADDFDTTYEYAERAVPTEPITVANKEYKYAGMNYVGFAAKNGTTVTVNYILNTTEGNIENTIENVPVKPNYRTNIVGNLITSKTGYVITLDKTWGTPEEVVNLWDGKTITAPAYNETTKTYSIAEPSELAWLAAAVNGTIETKATEAPKTFNGETFVLTKDVDLNGQSWTPIGNGTQFQGTFDGQNHTVKNLVVNGGSSSNQGLFGTTTNGEVKNLVIENARVSGRLNVAVVAGNPYTSKYTNITVKGHVEVNGMAYVGGVGGKNAYANWENITVEVDETSYVKANSVENGTAYRTYVGGVVGFNGEGSHSFKNITSNINVSGSTCDVGGLFGIAHYGNMFEDLTCTGNVEITNAEEAGDAEEIGGIAGVWHNADGYTVTMNNVSFTGQITTNVERGTVWYGNLVGKPYGNGNGKLILNGVEMIMPGLVKDGDEFKVENSSALQKAFALVENGETITIEEDMTVTETTDPNGNVVYYTGDKSFTLNLNGKTIKGNTSNVVFRFQKSEGEENTITIKNGTIIADANTWSAISVGSSCETKTMVNLIDLNIQSQKANDMAVRARTGAEFTMTNCTVSATNGAGGICAGGGNITLDNVTVNQKGWYSSNWNSVALGVSGGGKITVNSGNYTSDPDGNTNCTWVAYVMSSGGTLEIKGGTFNGKVAETAEASKACGLICADTKAVVEIKGGIFNSNGAILDMRNNTGATPNPSAVLYGGTFSSDPRVSGLYGSNLITVAKGFEVIEKDGKWIVRVKPTTVIGTTEYETLEAAIAAAQPGETIKLISDVTLSEELELPAGIIFNGNGKQINGSIYAGGDLTFEGHTKVATFSASYYDRTITIGEGACLEVTGNGRVTLGYSNTFEVKGNLTDAKNADKSKLQPSLIIPGGISITGSNDAVINIKDAYVQIGNTSSKNSVANGTFTLNIENSIAEFTNQITFAEPTSGKNPTFKMNVKNSVVTTPTKLCIAAPNSTVVIDNSTVTLGSYLRNSGELKLMNGSTLTGATIQFGENGGNDGAIIVDNSVLTVNASSTGHAFDGKGTGSITAANGAEVNVDYYKAMTISVDATSTFTGTEVQ